MELVSARLIKRLPGLEAYVSKRRVEQARNFAKKRGFCKPVVLSDSNGCMTLLAGAATYEACLEEKAAKIPAVIVKTEGEADNLVFALQSAGQSDTFDAVAAGCAIVQLIDTYGIARKYIALALGKSPAWLSGMENLGRKLNASVRQMVAEGHISSRSAQEIARLPDEVQLPFAISAGNELLSKENVAYLVNRYLHEDAGSEERDRIVRTPNQALANCLYRRKRRGRDDSDSTCLSRALARCFDDAAYISNLLGRVDVGDIAIRDSDGDALIDALTALCLRLRTVFHPGEKND
jgi:ParB-like chromosome segregation protein Spo0J